MSWTQTRSSSRSLLPAQPNDMVKNEFIALDRGLLKHPSALTSWRCPQAAPGVDASAIHGRPGARVALLQSPILPAAASLYPGKEIFGNLPVDKPHTCNLEPLKPKVPEKALLLVVSWRPVPRQVVCPGQPGLQWPKPLTKPGLGRPGPTTWSIGLVLNQTKRRAGLTAADR
jgi:hypothetical protein